MAHSLRALGRGDLPQRLIVGSREYQLARIAKHDFYAATGFYENIVDASDRVVLKMGRSEPIAGFPMSWSGRFLIRREIRFHRALADVPNVPQLIATLDGDLGLVHRFIPGVPLKRGRAAPDGFFRELEHVIAVLHERDIAYVDANKMSNILVGDDGRPYLIDFQISFDLATMGDHRLSRWLLARFKREDNYHILKHKRRLSPHELTRDERERTKSVSWFIRLHRMIANPYKRFRRHIVRRLFESGRISWQQRVG